MEDLTNGITETINETVSETTNVIADSIGESVAAEIAETAVGEVANAATTPEFTTGQKVAMGVGGAVIGGAIVYGTYRLGKFVIKKAKAFLDSRKKQKEAEKATSIEQLERKVSELERSVNNVDSSERSED